MRWGQPVSDDSNRPWFCLECGQNRDVCKCKQRRLFLRAGGNATQLGALDDVYSTGQPSKSDGRITT